MRASIPISNPQIDNSSRYASILLHPSQWSLLATFFISCAMQNEIYSFDCIRQHVAVVLLNPLRRRALASWSINLIDFKFRAT